MGQIRRKSFYLRGGDMGQVVFEKGSKEWQIFQEFYHICEVVKHFCNKNTE